MGQPVVHFEVVGKDGDKLQKYYSELFGWEINSDNPMNYGMVEKQDDDGIAGGVGQGPDGYDGHVTFYVAVPDVEAALAKAESLGGTRVMGPENIMDMVVLGQFKDPEGHVIGVVKDEMLARRAGGRRWHSDPVTTPAVETRGLSKTYQGKTRALVGLDLRVERGEVFGYLGPNGAGKSTTIRLLLDLIHATAGSASVLGLDSRRQGVEARRRIGYLPGDLRLNDRHDRAASSSTRSRACAAAPTTASATELCERFALELDRPIRHLSKGNRQKVGLVQAFMHRPELVVLDEPSSGLDPLLQAEVRELLRETAADGRTVFLSSHSLDEVQHAADRVGIIRCGRLVDVDAVEHLRERALRHVTIVFAEPVDAARFEGLDGVRVDGVEDSVVRLSAPEPAMDAIVKEAAAHRIVDLVSQPADLEEIFLELYEEPPGAD